MEQRFLRTVNRLWVYELPEITCKIVSSLYVHFFGGKGPKLSSDSQSLKPKKTLEYWFRFKNAINEKKK